MLGDRLTPDISGKQVGIRDVEGPVGVHSRNFSKARSKLLGWEAQMYAWVEGQVREFAVK